jgi:hypothetical protein
MSTSPIELTYKVLRRAKSLIKATKNPDSIVKDFIRKGVKPWTTGYYEYKWKNISEVINQENFTKLIGTTKYGYRIDERIVELPWLFSRLSSHPGKLLDAGSALNFSVLLKQPKLSNKKVFISTLAPENQSFNKLGVSYIYEDIRETCFQNEFFDEIACISTIEHVGLDNTFLYTSDNTKNEQSKDGYLSFLDVIFSRLKPGGRLYLSFPYGIQKNHGWFQVFNAHQIDGMIAHLKATSVDETIFHYKDDKWSITGREGAAQSICYDINVDKTHAPDYCAFSQSVACLQFTK